MQKTCLRNECEDADSINRRVLRDRLEEVEVCVCVVVWVVKGGNTFGGVRIFT